MNVAGSGTLDTSKAVAKSVDPFNANVIWGPTSTDDLNESPANEPPIPTS
jgi:hypothetical protein